MELGSGIGWMLAIVALAGVREKDEVFQCSGTIKRFGNYVHSGGVNVPRVFEFPWILRFKRS
jgi:Na+-transporting NADH:ubiquinone oxidoreductase subunit NqrE